jgi:hypothetical protein
LPVVLKKNIRDNQSKLEKNLQDIEKFLGKFLTFEANFAELYEQITDPSYRDRLGEILYDSYMKNVTSL